MATAQRSEPVAVVRHRFTVDEYERMGATGILGPDERLELIDGEIVEMSPIGPLHAAVVARIHDLLSEGVRGKHLVRSQSPIRLSDRSEPQPDGVVLRHRADYYAGAHPAPADILLLVEVSDTTFAYDREVKLPLYAAAGVAEVWVVDVAAQLVEQHTQPAQGVYTQVRKALLGTALAAAAIPGLSLATEQIF